DHARLPQMITLYAAHVAASCPVDQVVLCIWEEDAQLVIAICEQGKLGYAQTLPSADAEMLLSELPRLLLGAEMEGVPTEFDTIRLEQGCTALGEPLRTFFEGKPVELMSFDGPLPETGGNLLPAEWTQETRRLERAGNLRQKLQMVVLIYLVLVAGAFAYLAFLKSRVQKVDRQLAETLPQVEYVKAQQARWQALAPAVEPARSTAEILRLLFENRPTGDVKFTIFDHQPASFRVQGEAPSATLAVEFVEKLRKEPGLEDFKIDSKPPNILPTGSASFSVFGSL
ncbi:MAG TPA: hypothetical protein VF614_14645, partial [Chthoniobacteraceae bacterium]